MINYVTGNTYSGQNIDALAEAGFSSEYWATYNQWMEAGFQVQKGQSGTTLMRVVEVKRKDKVTGEEKKIKVPKYFNVFNQEQVAKIEVAA